MLGLDHLYLAVSDFAAAERFYDGVMKTLGAAPARAGKGE
jgi:hypothetical protein